MHKYSRHKPRGVFHRFKDRLRFLLERFLLRGLGYRLLLAAMIVVIVAIVTGELAFILAPEITEASEGIWWAFLRLTDPGYLGDDEGFFQRSISTIVTVLGYVLFLGLLIAILTQWMNQFIAKLESGVIPVAVSQHLLILGWTHRTPAIVKELLRTGKRAERFLKRRGAREIRIVILAEHVDSALLQELKVHLGDLWNDRQVMLRSGTPLNIEHLERVAFRNAAVLILPGADFSDQRPGVVDAENIKTLLSVSRHAGASGSRYPLAVTELFDVSRSSIAHKAYDGNTEIVAADELIARLMAQSMRQKGLWSVFSELLTPHVGNTLYVRSHIDLAGLRFDDLRACFPRAIAIGTVRSGDLKPVLNPDPDSTISEGDQLVFIARSFNDCVPQPTGSDGYVIRKKVPPRSAQEDRRQILILGWSRTVPFLLQELERHGGESFRIDVAGLKPVESREQILANYAPGLRGNSVQHMEANFLVPSVLASLKPERYDDILIMARESMGDEAGADAASVSAYLTLRSLLPTDGSGPDLTVELLGEENLFRFDDKVEDVILSPLLVSYVLSQVALKRELAAVVSEFCRPWGTQVILEPASDLVSTHEPVRFSDIENVAGERGLIALGLQRGSGAEARVDLNPDRDAEWKLAPDDRIVVLATFEK